ncbi:MAG: DUF4240 domain-containing protein [Spirochaetota bacterium]
MDVLFHGMEEELFWQVIERIEHGAKAEEKVSASVQFLSYLSEDNIVAFYESLSEKLFHLDQEKYANPILEGREHFSADTFLYARAFVVSQGSAFYQKVLDDPALMPIEETFEPLLYIPEKAYFLKTGKNLLHVPQYCDETYSNRSGWPADTPSILEIIRRDNADAQLIR